MRSLALARAEVAAVAALALCLAALAAAGEAVAASSIPYTLGWMARSAPLAAALGVGLQALYRYADGGSPAAYLRELRSGAFWVGWLRLWLACWVASFAYFWVKVYVPRLHVARFDGALGALDRAIHFGVVPPLEAFAGLASWSGALDAWYALWLASVVWCLSFFAASTRPGVREGVVLSCVLLWTLGSWLYVALPAVGPAFAAPDSWGGLADRMPRAAQAQAILWENHERVLAGAGPDAFRHTLGVAALPSLHVAFHVLFTAWARVAAPLLFWPFAIATAATFAGSLATGWHYAVDGYAGAALAGACFAIARVVTHRDDAAEARPDRA